MRLQGIRFDTAEVVEVEVKDGLIASVKPLESAAAQELPWISPGWFDLQVNGFNGFDFNGETTTVQDVVGVTEALYQRGVTHYLPTVITGSLERIKQAVTTIAEACERYPDVCRSVVGIHLEGPYISGEDGPRGAHARTYVRDPNWEEFAQWQEASGNRIRLVTVAPERKGAIAFIRRLKEAGITVSLGHTCANADELAQAVAAGAALSTHLGNGAHTQLQRHPNYIWNQLGEDRLWATFIADGHHLSPPVLKAMLRAKRDQFILVSDSVKFGGLSPGRYSSVIGAEVELHPDGRLTPIDNPLILAGSAEALDVGVSNAVRYAGISWSEAIEAVTLRPARLLGLSGPGREWLEVGSEASFTLFRQPDRQERIRISAVVLNGETKYSFMGGGAQ
ncbi:N-acetylglucosamine-6-phosphate deacetylase [Paenibacillus rigui]|uniref:N-acetylglucosamine-6-phosphate deacetylase n=1 Tax=Paenibacillus rigui TaxID=554312 RepID=A0A229USW8_9BACL|nr:amidohydrolase family protein [Paenibacillus rigui]OXM86727.1 N-acetylglucosamine-6-phosphate deacetylase [Paenibacillus rigui]